MVIDSMVASAQLEEGLRQKVREAMLKRHHHQKEKKLSNRIPLVRSFADIGKKQSDPHLLERNGSLSTSAPPSSRESRGSQFLSRFLLSASTPSSPLSTPRTPLP
ncbi:sodium bicarbonate cotransporter 3-like [Salvelinus sp. IW2-2015]|uniref:sodium bicarbonate cotransporter 3-like n=1 Tax=Salvelinus sp. IW2-2015 TaxID=2691554 RepID=UPI000CEA8486|nr:sodium bicarbonate cotransporter 3-like [Salvelinus alpinus]